MHSSQPLVGAVGTPIRPNNTNNKSPSSPTSNNTNTLSTSPRQHRHQHNSANSSQIDHTNDRSNRTQRSRDEKGPTTLPSPSQPRNLSKEQQSSHQQQSPQHHHHHHHHHQQQQQPDQQQQHKIRKKRVQKKDRALGWLFHPTVILVMQVTLTIISLYLIFTSTRAWINLFSSPLWVKLTAQRVEAREKMDLLIPNLVSIDSIWPRLSYNLVNLQYNHVSISVLGSTLTSLRNIIVYSIGFIYGSIINLVFLPPMFIAHQLGTFIVIIVTILVSVARYFFTQAVAARISGVKPSHLRKNLANLTRTIKDKLNSSFLLRRGLQNKIYSKYGGSGSGGTESTIELLLVQYLKTRNHGNLLPLGLEDLLRDPTTNTTTKGTSIDNNSVIANGDGMGSLPPFRISNDDQLSGYSYEQFMNNSSLGQLQREHQQQSRQQQHGLEKLTTPTRDHHSKRRLAQTYGDITSIRGLGGDNDIAGDNINNNQNLIVNSENQNDDFVIFDNDMDDSTDSADLSQDGSYYTESYAETTTSGAAGLHGDLRAAISQHSAGHNDSDDEANLSALFGDADPSRTPQIIPPHTPQSPQRTLGRLHRSKSIGQGLLPYSTDTQDTPPSPQQHHPITTTAAMTRSTFGRGTDESGMTGSIHDTYISSPLLSTPNRPQTMGRGSSAGSVRSGRDDDEGLTAFLTKDFMIELDALNEQNGFQHLIVATEIECNKLLVQLPQALQIHSTAAEASSHGIGHEFDMMGNDLDEEEILPHRPLLDAISPRRSSIGDPLGTPLQVQHTTDPEGSFHTGKGIGRDSVSDDFQTFPNPLSQPITTQATTTGTLIPTHGDTNDATSSNSKDDTVIVQQQPNKPMTFREAQTILLKYQKSKSNLTKYKRLLTVYQLLKVAYYNDIHRTSHDFTCPVHIYSKLYTGSVFLVDKMYSRLKAKKRLHGMFLRQMDQVQRSQQHPGGKNISRSEELSTERFPSRLQPQSQFSHQQYLSTLDDGSEFNGNDDIITIPSQFIPPQITQPVLDLLLPTISRHQTPFHDQVKGMMELIAVKNGFEICTAGQPANYLYIVLEGECWGFVNDLCVRHFLNGGVVGVESIHVELDQEQVGDHDPTKNHYKQDTTPQWSQMPDNTIASYVQTVRVGTTYNPSGRFTPLGSPKTGLHHSQSNHSRRNSFMTNLAQSRRNSTQKNGPNNGQKDEIPGDTITGMEFTNANYSSDKSKITIYPTGTDRVDADSKNSTNKFTIKASASSFNYPRSNKTKKVSPILPLSISLDRYSILLRINHRDWHQLVKSNPTVSHSACSGILSRVARSAQLTLHLLLPQPYYDINVGVTPGLFDNETRQGILQRLQVEIEQQSYENQLRGSQNSQDCHNISDTDASRDSHTGHQSQKLNNDDEKSQKLVSNHPSIYSPIASIHDISNFPFQIIRLKPGSLLDTSNSIISQYPIENISKKHPIFQDCTTPLDFYSHKPLAEGYSVNTTQSPWLIDVIPRSSIAREAFIVLKGNPCVHLHSFYKNTQVTPNIQPEYFNNTDSSWYKSEHRHHHHHHHHHHNHHHSSSSSNVPPLTLTLPNNGSTTSSHSRSSYLNATTSIGMVGDRGSNMKFFPPQSRLSPLPTGPKPSIDGLLNISKMDQCGEWDNIPLNYYNNQKYQNIDLNLARDALLSGQHHGDSRFTTTRDNRYNAHKSHRGTAQSGIQHNHHGKGDQSYQIEKRLGIHQSAGSINRVFASVSTLFIQPGDMINGQSLYCNRPCDVVGIGNVPKDSKDQISDNGEDDIILLVLNRHDLDVYLRNYETKQQNEQGFHPPASSPQSSSAVTFPNLSPQSMIHADCDPLLPRGHDGIEVSPCDPDGTPNNNDSSEQSQLYDLQTQTLKHAQTTVTPLVALASDCTKNNDDNYTGGQGHSPNMGSKPGHQSHQTKSQTDIISPLLSPSSSLSNIRDYILSRSMLSIYCFETKLLLIYTRLGMRSVFKSSDHVIISSTSPLSSEICVVTSGKCLLTTQSLSQQQKLLSQGNVIPETTTTNLKDNSRDSEVVVCNCDQHGEKTHVPELHRLLHSLQKTRVDRITNELLAPASGSSSSDQNVANGSTTAHSYSPYNTDTSYLSSNTNNNTANIPLYTSATSSAFISPLDDPSFSQGSNVGTSVRALDPNLLEFEKTPVYGKEQNTYRIKSTSTSIEAPVFQTKVSVGEVVGMYVAINCAIGLLQQCGETVKKINYETKNDLNAYFIATRTLRGRTLDPHAERLRQLKLDQLIPKCFSTVLNKMENTTTTSTMKLDTIHDTEVIAMSVTSLLLWSKEHNTTLLNLSRSVLALTQQLTPQTLQYQYSHMTRSIQPMVRPLGHGLNSATGQILTIVDGSDRNLGDYSLTQVNNLDPDYNCFNPAVLEEFTYTSRGIDNVDNINNCSYCDCDDYKQEDDSSNQIQSWDDIDSESSYVGNTPGCNNSNASNNNNSSSHCYQPHIFTNSLTTPNFAPSQTSQTTSCNSSIATSTDLSVITETSNAPAVKMTKDGNLTDNQYPFDQTFPSHFEQITPETSHHSSQNHHNRCSRCNRYNHQPIQIKPPIHVVAQQITDSLKRHQSVMSVSNDDVNMLFGYYNYRNRFDQVLSVVIPPRTFKNLPIESQRQHLVTYSQHVVEYNQRYRQLQHNLRLFLLNRKLYNNSDELKIYRLGLSFNVLERFSDTIICLLENKATENNYNYVQNLNQAMVKAGYGGDNVNSANNTTTAAGEVATAAGLSFPVPHPHQNQSSQSQLHHNVSSAPSSRFDSFNNYNELYLYSNQLLTSVINPHPSSSFLSTTPNEESNRGPPPIENSPQDSKDATLSIPTPSQTRPPQSQSLFSATKPLTQHRRLENGGLSQHQTVTQSVYDAWTVRNAESIIIVQQSLQCQNLGWCPFHKKHDQHTTGTGTSSPIGMDADTKAPATPTRDAKNNNPSTPASTTVTATEPGEQPLPFQSSPQIITPVDTIYSSLHKPNQEIEPEYHEWVWPQKEEHKFHCDQYLGIIPLERKHVLKFFQNQLDAPVNTKSKTGSWCGRSREKNDDTKNSKACGDGINRHRFEPYTGPVVSTNPQPIVSALSPATQYIPPRPTCKVTRYEHDLLWTPPNPITTPSRSAPKSSPSSPSGAQQSPQYYSPTYYDSQQEQQYHNRPGLYSHRFLGRPVRICLFLYHAPCVHQPLYTSEYLSAGPRRCDFVVHARLKLDDNRQIVMNDDQTDDSDENDINICNIPPKKSSYMLTTYSIEQCDLDRLSRRLLGRHLALVCGGGGARGLSHLGVMGQMLLNYLSCDCLAGTSQGAWASALYATAHTSLFYKPQLYHTHELPPHNLNITETLAYLNSSEPQRPQILPVTAITLDPMFHRMLSFCQAMSQLSTLLADSTFPILAFFTGYTFNNLVCSALGYYGDYLQVEDCWLEIAQTSTNLSRSGLSVHRDGPLWHSTRSSMSVIGLLPPVHDPKTNDLLIDGGYVNNLPADLALEVFDKPGYVISVDVENKDERHLQDITSVVTPTVGGWKLLWLKLLRTFIPTNNPKQWFYPSYSDIVSSLFYVAHGRHQHTVGRYIDSYIRPSVQSYQLLDYDKVDQIFTAGVNGARDELELLITSRIDLDVAKEEYERGNGVFTRV